MRLTHKLVLLLVFTMLRVEVSAQSGDVLILDENKAAMCEAASSYLAGFTSSVRQDQSMIVISTSGRTETAPMLAQKRLMNLTIYLVAGLHETGFGRKKENLLPAIGARPTETGQIEVLIDGKPKLRILFMKNRGLSLGPCVVEGRPPCSDPLKKLYSPCSKYSPDAL